MKARRFYEIDLDASPPIVQRKYLVGQQPSTAFMNFTDAKRELIAQLKKAAEEIRLRIGATRALRMDALLPSNSIHLRRKS